MEEPAYNHHSGPSMLRSMPSGPWKQRPALFHSEAREHTGNGKKDIGNVPQRLVWLSRNLAMVLRHGADKRGVNLEGPEKWARLSQILALPGFASHTEADLEEVVRESHSGDQPRFEIKKEATGQTWIRATHKHTLSSATPFIPSPDFDGNDVTRQLPPLPSFETSTARVLVSRPTEPDPWQEPGGESDPWAKGSAETVVASAIGFLPTPFRNSAGGNGRNAGAFRNRTEWKPAALEVKCLAGSGSSTPPTPPPPSFMSTKDKPEVSLPAALPPSLRTLPQTFDEKVVATPEVSLEDPEVRLEHELSAPLKPAKVVEFAFRPAPKRCPLPPPPAASDSRPPPPPPLPPPPPNDPYPGTDTRTAELVGDLPPPPAVSPPQSPERLCSDSKPSPCERSPAKAPPQQAVAASLHRWEQYASDAGDEPWWWCEASGDWFSEANPSPWQKFEDPVTSRSYWWKIDSIWFWTHTGCIQP